MNKGFLIVEAGATKADWTLIPANTNIPVRLQSSGINPVHSSSEQIRDICLEIKGNLPDNVKPAIKFFGAGCASFDLKKKIETILEDIFQPEEILIESDLYASCLALFGDLETGLACILGTGSATALYQKGEISKKIPSLGYLLGDEGSGVDLGKRLLNMIFKERCSELISNLFREEYKLTLDELLNRVYRQPNSVAYIASFSKFVSRHIDKEEIYELVKEAFKDFFQKNVTPYNLKMDCPVRFTGSIAISFEKILVEVGKHLNYNVDKVIKAPMPLLEKFYMER